MFSTELFQMIPSLQLENANDIIDVVWNIRDISLLYDGVNCKLPLRYLIEKFGRNGKMSGNFRQKWTKIRLFCFRVSDNLSFYLINGPEN